MSENNKTKYDLPEQGKLDQYQRVFEYIKLNQPCTSDGLDHYHVNDLLNLKFLTGVMINSSDNEFSFKNLRVTKLGNKEFSKSFIPKLTVTHIIAIILGLPSASYFCYKIYDLF